jgi:hypothetical protein
MEDKGQANDKKVSSPGEQAEHSEVKVESRDDSDDDENDDGSPFSGRSIFTNESGE